MNDIKLANIDELEADLTDIANAIRIKNQTWKKYTLEEMPSAISWNGWNYDDIALGGKEEEIYLTVNPKQYAFTGTNITKLFGTYTAGSGYTFDGCKKLTEIDLPNYVGGNITNEFAECTALTTVKLPKLKQVSTRFFYNNPNLIKVSLPSLENVSQQMFYLNSNLEEFDFLGKPTSSIGSGAWEKTKLNELIIRGNFVVPLGNISAFNSTPFSANGTGGILYVPESQIEAYKVATNWAILFGDTRDSAYINNSIVKIENSPFENYYVDGTEVY